MPDANGIIFKNPTLNTWFAGPSVDLTAWNVITVSDCTDAAFKLEYTYVPATAKWTNGIRNIWKDTLWYMSDGAITYSAEDNGLPIPPSTFYRILDYPLTITVSGTGVGTTYPVDGLYNLDGAANGAPRYTKGPSILSYQADGYWTIFYFIQLRSWSSEQSGTVPPKTGWSISTAGDPAPYLEYTLSSESDTATVAPASSSATWVSANPSSGFVSLTDTPDEDFGYVITFDVQGGANYPYYKYCTKTAGEVYGTLPEPTREAYIFAGWYTAPEGQGTRVTATDELVVAEDDTLYAKWVKRVSGKVGCAASLVSMFALGIGTDIFCEYIGSRLAKTTPQTIVRKLPRP